MRFVLSFLFCLSLSTPPLAAPGDILQAKTDQAEKPAIKRQLRSSDIPFAPDGFSLKKLALHLGSIKAFAVQGDDVFVADSAQDRILRLRSRTDAVGFETRSEFLIGFDGLSDIAATDRDLFMADRSGVWRIVPGRNLVATTAPEFIFKTPPPSKDKPIVLALSPDAKTLYFGLGRDLFSYQIEHRSQKIVSGFQGEIEQLAVSPSGSLWVAIRENGNSAIIPVRAGSDKAARLEFPRGTQLHDLGFWPLDSFPDSWPQEWKSDLLIAMGGNLPMIARAHFNFGDIAPQYTAFIDGFSNPSRIVGRREYWGIPSAMAILENGQIIFAQKQQGLIWVVEKSDIEVRPDAPVTEPKAEISSNSAKKDKSFFPELLQGSSIKSASGLETDELLKAQQKSENDLETDKEDKD